MLDETLLFHAEIALGLVLKHRQHVDGVPRQAKVGLGALLLIAEIKNPKLHLHLRLERDGQKLESRGREWIVRVAHDLHFSGCGALMLNWDFSVSETREDNMAADE